MDRSPCPLATRHKSPEQHSLTLRRTSSNASLITPSNDFTQPKASTIVSLSESPSSLLQARALAEGILPVLKASFQWNDIAFDEQYTREWSRGWTFIFNTTLSQQTGQPRDGLVGNGPVFVDKYSGHLFLLPSGGWKRWLQTYEETGDAQGVQPTLPLVSARDGTHTENGFGEE